MKGSANCTRLPVLLRLRGKSPEQTAPIAAFFSIFARKTSLHDITNKV